MHQHTAVSLSAERARMPLKQCASEYVAEIPIAVALSTTRRIDHVVWHSVGALLPAVGVHIIRRQFCLYATSSARAHTRCTLREAAAACCARMHTSKYIYAGHPVLAYSMQTPSPPHSARARTWGGGIFFFLCTGLFRERGLPLDPQRETRPGQQGSISGIYSFWLNLVEVE